MVNKEKMINIKNIGFLIMLIDAIYASDADIEDVQNTRNLSIRRGRTSPLVTQVPPSQGVPDTPRPTRQDIHLSYLLEKLTYHRSQVARLEAQLNTLVLGREGTPPNEDIHVSQLGANVRDSFEMMETEGSSSSTSVVEH